MERLLDFRSCWIVFIHVVRSRPGGLLQFSKGEAVKIFLASVSSTLSLQYFSKSPLCFVFWLDDIKCPWRFFLHFYVLLVVIMFSIAKPSDWLRRLCFLYQSGS